MKFTHRITSITHEPFSNVHIRKVLDDVMSHVMYDTNGQGTLCDPFARESFTTLLPNCITNDLNPEFKCDYNLEFKEFAYTIQERGHVLDLVFFDPPYSLTQLKKQYENRQRLGTMANQEYVERRQRYYCSYDAFRVVCCFAWMEC